MVKKFQKEFISYCNNQQLEVNSNQIQIVKRLEQYYQVNFKSYFSKLFSKKLSQKGFYLYGDVGVGKTMILNFFYENTQCLMFYDPLFVTFNQSIHSSNMFFFSYFIIH